MEKIKLYGADWCPDCTRTKRYLDEQDVAFEYIDITKDPEAVSYVQKINDGKRSIPTLVFPDGSVLVEPSNDALGKKLCI